MRDGLGRPENASMVSASMYFASTSVVHRPSLFPGEASRSPWRLEGRGDLLLNRVRDRPFRDSHQHLLKESPPLIIQVVRDRGAGEHGPEPAGYGPVFPVA